MEQKPRSGVLSRRSFLKTAAAVGAVGFTGASLAGIAGRGIGGRDAGLYLSQRALPVQLHAAVHRA